MSEDVNSPPIADGSDVLSELPGELMMWVLIVSELFVFGAFLIVFLSVRIANPGQFAADRGPHLPLVVGPGEGEHGVTLLGRGGDHAHLADPGDRHL